MDSVNALHGQPLILGEVLFDQFPEGAVLGGAPLNVAWNLKGLGADPILLSRIGEDEAGEQVRAAMQRQGLSLEALQRDPDHPTGAVRVELDAQGIPGYTILPDQAYDHIHLDPKALEAFRPSLLYRGSLAARTVAAHRQFQDFIPALGCPVFLDLNLRDPWWRPQAVREMLRTCDWLKLNQDELLQVAQMEGIPARDAIAQAQQLREILNLKSVLLTLGAAGAMMITPDQVYQADPVPVPQMVDTVGAGDAFSAVAILGLLQGWSEAIVLERAVCFAAALCGITGGTPQDRGFYDPFRAEWGMYSPLRPGHTGVSSSYMQHR
ncbi:MAG: carbohydrate kinase [Thermostichus sp. HHBFW_bins_43]